MASSKPTVLVLWGNYFDEHAATVFVCTLRAAGVRVRIVGVDSRLARGRYGMTLGTEWTVDHALQQWLPNTHLVAPCQAEQWRLLLQNPAAHRLLLQARRASTLIVAPQTSAAYAEEDLPAVRAAVPPLPLQRICLWSEEETPEAVAQRLVGLLQG